jgi:hypothetical protein
MDENGERGPTAPGGAPDDRIITPDREPSALERGARILERLRRKPPAKPSSG